MSESAPESKAALRRRMKAGRKAVPAPQRRACAQAVARHVLALPELAQPRRVCVPVSFRAELPTPPLIRALLDAGHTVSVPRLHGPEMQAHALFDLDDLVERTGQWGIPTSDGPVVSAQVQVVLVPGLAFTVDGHRVGFGAGYYDRFLAAHPSAVPIAIAYELQVVPEVPVQDHDRPVAAVVTEAGVHRGWPQRAVRVVGGAVVRDGKLLAARRAPHKSQGGWWEIPGGKVELGETDGQALVRELREELGIEVRPLGPIAQATHPYPTAAVTLVALHAEWIAGEPAGPDHDAIAWVDALGIDRLAWAPADRPLLAALRSLVDPGSDHGDPVR